MTAVSRLAPFAALLALLVSPLASAQVPELPGTPEVPADPGAAVGIACDLVGGAAPDVRDALPLCPAGNDPAPAEPAQADEAAQPTHQEEEIPSPTQDPAGAAEGLAGEAQGAAEEIAEDPTSAPDVLLGLVATLRDLVERIVQVPYALAGAAGSALATVTGALGGALDAAREALADVGVKIGAAGSASKDGLVGAIESAKGAAIAAKGGVAAVASGLADLVSHLLQPPASAHEARELPRVPGAAEDAAGAADGLLARVTGALGR